MGHTTGDRIGSPSELLRYRPWRGQLRGPFAAVGAIARVALGLMLRRKMFWGMYALGVLVFLFFFFGQYIILWGEARYGEETVRLGSQVNAPTVKPADIIRIFRDQAKLTGSEITYRSFIWFEGTIVMIVLALAGSVLVGNDFQHGSLSFYLAKPIGRWHYVLGKALAVGVIINLLTTVPALLLWLQYGVLDTFDYYWDRFELAVGIVGYGLALTVTLSLVLLATASWLRRTVPLVMVWTALFVLGPLLANFLVGRLGFHPRWRLIDLWNDLYLVGNFCLRAAHDRIIPSPQPTYLEAALVIGAVCLLCLIDLSRRIRAVEIVQ
jgi:ABC-type transport system involved in multi-copper enzyme maturation permease subunit